MIVVGIRLGGAASPTEINRGLTVLNDLDVQERHRIATELAAVLRGEPGNDLEVEVEVDGQRRMLTSDLARELALPRAAGAVVVLGPDLPGAVAMEEPRDLAAAEAEVATAEAVLAEAKAELAEARRSLAAAEATLLAAQHRVDKDAPAILAAAEARLAEARSAAGDAGRILDEAERAAAGAEIAHRETASRLAALRAERTGLETQRAEIVSRLAASEDPADPSSVEAALAGLRRLRQVKPKPSAKATDLADRWAEVSARLAALPQPPQPPEWLVIPALAALHEARAAAAEVENAPTPVASDPALTEALEAAHREVLEAEQRAMKKGSRANRRRLDAAHAAEQAALAALGVGSYGEYLQGETGGDGGGRDERLAAARAALADAEAVWEELHGGEASPEWTAAKEAQARIREEARELLGGDVDDDEAEDRLRNHLDKVVETGWAENELSKALADAGVAAGDSPEVTADRWLNESPAMREAHRLLETQLSEIDGRLSVVDEQLAETKADAFFGEGGDAATGAASPPAPTAVSRMDVLAQALEQARRAVVNGVDAVDSAKERLAASEHERGRIPALEDEVSMARRRVDEAGERVRHAESALAAVAAAAAAGTGRPDANGAMTPAVAGPTPGPGTYDVSGVVGMEVEAYLLARVAALRGAVGGPLPLVIDVAAVAGLNDGASRRVLRLLGRLVASMQIVVLGDDEKVSKWAEGVGDHAAVRSVVR